MSVAVDPAGQAYLTGLTVATDFPTTAGAYLEDAPPKDPGVGTNSSFVARIGPSDRIFADGFQGP